MNVDLHLHTWVSDGDVSPAEVVRIARAAGLGAIAITDHDTAAGVGEAVQAAQDHSMHVIPGIEISTRIGEWELHILGYWIDPMSTPILDHQHRAVRRRSDRIEAMLERLRGIGVTLSLADVQAAAGPTVHTLGRPHLARALHHAGVTRYYGDAFTRFIGDGGPAFVAEGFPAPGDAIETIHAAGGVAVWAHPQPEAYEDLLPKLVDWGLDGVECYRPGIAPVDSLHFVERARRSSLFPTGGSDWHGPNRFQLGVFNLPAASVREVLAMGGIAA